MASLRKVPDDVIATLRRKFINPDTALPIKYRILFALRNLEGAAASQALMEALDDESALLRHEVAYCLGQRQDPGAVEVLKRTLQNTSEHPMVRHEAGEALGAIGTEECVEPLKQFVNDGSLEVAQTCQLALQRLQYFQAQAAVQGGTPQAAVAHAESAYLSVDPTPAAPASTPTEQLRATLLDESARMFDRYAAMFALRNKGGAEAVEALGAAFGCGSALLKHEVAYVLGQMQQEAAVDVLRRVLADGSENAMVRHEAAEALGSIAEPQCIQLLKLFAEDQEPIVAHSCLVALDMLEFEQAGGFDYTEVAT